MANSDDRARLPVVTKDRLLHELLPYWMQAVDTLNLALRFRMKWAEPPPMSIHIGGELAVEGNLNGFTNPAIEMAIADEVIE
jgi:hypothetical protein